VLVWGRAERLALVEQQNFRAQRTSMLTHTRASLAEQRPQILEEIMLQAPTPDATMRALSRSV